MDNLQDLLPIGNPTGEEHQRQPLPPRQPWRFGAAAEDNQLLPQQGILGQKFSAAARQIGQCASHEIRTTGRPNYAAKELVGGGERRDHKFLAHRPSWLNMTVYAPDGRGCRGSARVYHGQPTP
jgi:hypothetical protein